MVNTYGLKMIGVQKACGATIHRVRSYIRISYDRENGRVLWEMREGEMPVDCAEDGRKGIIPICNTCEHMKKQEIADAIYRVMQKLPQDG